MGLIPTPSQTVGPFFHVCLTERSIGCLAGPGAAGERIRLACRVLDGGGVPVDDALLEVWQADAGGRFRHPEDPRQEAADRAFGGFGRLPTDQDGACLFETIKPGCVPGADGTREAPHLTLAVFARGLLKTLLTRIYFAGDPANAADPVLSLVPPERRHTLMAQPDAQRPGSWNFIIRLSGDDETVFFDV